MSGLFDSLSAASNALTAHRMGLDVAGQNLANLNTVGYSRRSLVLAEMPSGDFLSAGRGVQVVQVRALRDLFVEARIRNERQGASFDETVVRHLSALEGAVGLPGMSLDAELTKFFDGFAALADDATSSTARDNVVRQGTELARAFGALSGQFSQARRAADAELRASVTNVNALADRVAALNGQIVHNGPNAEALRDERAVLLNELSELTDISVISRDDGAVDVTVAGGRALVINADAYHLKTTTGADGFASIKTATDFDITAAISGGRIGGLINTRDTKVPAYLAKLDQMAYDLANAVNAAHGAGYDGTGAPAGSFFSAPAGVAGAAAALQVDAAVAANSQLVAASLTGAAGDNQTARAIADLRSGAIVAGGTLTPAEAWGQLVFSLGSDVSSSTISAVSRGEVVRQLVGIQAQTSGVSVDEEAANLMRYQRAYAATARYFTTIVDTLDVLMGMV
jgi:flagellar hook-associated protein 1 FlgK